MTENIAAYIFTGLTSVVFVFQGCLAAGLPWGKASMGGKFPGKYPPKMRIAAMINMLVLGLLSCIVLTNARVIFPEWHNASDVGIWVVIAFLSLGTVLNTITPSKIERIWAPVALSQTLTAIFVALH